ncbi:MAG: hypothetical protein ABJC62_14205 [Frankiaceae bacterium]
MSDNSMSSGIQTKQVVDWTDLGKEMWSYLTGQGAVIDYSFVDMTIEVPRDTGPEAPRATWRLNGTLRISTRDRDNAGALGS